MRCTPAFSCGVHIDSSSAGSIGRGSGPALAALHAQKALLDRREQPRRLVVAVGGDHVDADHGMRLRPIGRGPVAGAIDLQAPAAADRARSARRRRRAGRGSAASCALYRLEPSSQIGTWVPRARDGAHRLVGPAVAQVRLQLHHVAREAFFFVAARQVAAQRAHRQPVGAGRAAQAEVDAAGVQRGQGAELLGDDQRRVVRQHHAARADADGLACRRRCGRSARQWPSWRRRPCCGARPPSSAGSPRLRRAGPGPGCFEVLARRRRLRQWARGRGWTGASWRASCLRCRRVLGACVVRRSAPARRPGWHTDPR